MELVRTSAPAKPTIMGQISLSDGSFSAAIAPDGAGYASFREGLPIISNVTNQVERPFFMPRLATESLTTVDPNQTTVVTNPTLGVPSDCPIA